VTRRRLVAVALALLVAGCGSSDGGGGDTGAVDTTPKSTYGSAPCPPAQPPAQTPRSFAGAPKRCIDAGVDYAADVATTEGTFTVDLLEREAPVTVNNFVVLARWGWFDGDDFHRVVPGFVIQAGDRFGQPPGSGGPGYSIPDELPTTADPYAAGAVAMANRGPSTGGSQWFVCVTCRGLKSNYALFGRVTAGMEVVQRIAALGTGDGPPSKPVGITKVTISER
jgi:cyclophilin family peptidyl-prolyl cis-trans isomerase